MIHDISDDTTVGCLSFRNGVRTQKGRYFSPDLPESIDGTDSQVSKEVSACVTSSTDVRVDDLDFVQEISKKIKPAKGNYLRFSKEVILKNYEGRKEKAL